MDREEGAGAGELSLGGRGEGMQAARELGNYNIMLIGPGKHQPSPCNFCLEARAWVKHLKCFLLCRSLRL